jgi:hypothetical protein
MELMQLLPDPPNWFHLNLHEQCLHCRLGDKLHNCLARGGNLRKVLCSADPRSEDHYEFLQHIRGLQWPVILEYIHNVFENQDNFIQVAGRGILKNYLMEYWDLGPINTSKFSMINTSI